jgi:hypothetical protein
MDQMQGKLPQMGLCILQHALTLAANERPGGASKSKFL